MCALNTLSVTIPLLAWKLRFRTGAVIQLVEGLLSMHKAPNWKSSTASSRHGGSQLLSQHSNFQASEP